MKAFSTDLRQRIVNAIDAKQGTHQQIADRFAVSVQFVRKLLRQRRQTGSIDPKPHGGGHTPIFDAATIERLKKAVAEHPDATLAELARIVGLTCSLSVIFRVLKNLGITRKKKSKRAAEQDDPELQAKRTAWLEEILEVEPERLVFLDETGTNTTMDRTHGRAASGKRVDGPVPHGHYKTITLTAAVRLSGVIESASLAFDGATDAAMFLAYVTTNLIPGLRPGDVVILDNLPSHKQAEVERLIQQAGARVCFLPPYSPDFNPIEAMFSKLKAFLRKAKARTKEAVIAALGAGLRSIGVSDMKGWFAHCGYRV